MSALTDISPAERVAFASQEVAYRACDDMERMGHVVEEGNFKIMTAQDKFQQAIKEQNEVIDSLEKYKKGFYAAAGVAATMTIVSIGLFLDRCAK